MKKIITLCAFTFLASNSVAANSDGLSKLQLNSKSSLELVGEYDLGHSLRGRYQLGGSEYNFLNDLDSSASTTKAWVGVAGEFGEVRAGYQDTLDTIATKDADQHRVGGAYDLIMRSDDTVKRSITYLQQSGGVGVAAQFGPAESETEEDSMGLMLNTQQGPYEAAIAYQRTPKSQDTLKGRVTYKSRNNSRVRLDLVAEKFEVGDSPVDEIKSDSMSFMVGAKYKLTPKAYVVGQYGVIGFDTSNAELTGDDLTLSRDYKALSLEAGYSLSESTSVFISHSQKNYDSSGLETPLFGGEEATQTNSIGVRLNW